MSKFNILVRKDKRSLLMWKIQSLFRMSVKNLEKLHTRLDRMKLYNLLNHQYSKELVKFTRMSQSIKITNNNKTTDHLDMMKILKKMIKKTIHLDFNNLYIIIYNKSIMFIPMNLIVSSKKIKLCFYFSIFIFPLILHKLWNITIADNDCDYINILYEIIVKINY